MNKKYEYNKLRDSVAQEILDTPSLGYTETLDAVAWSAMAFLMLGIVNEVNTNINFDPEIYLDSAMDELRKIFNNNYAKISTLQVMKDDVE